jgi:multiple sugar transport system permease protein
VFALFPIGYAFYLSLYKYRLFTGDSAFVGAQNYVASFAEPPFWNAMWNSFRFAVMSVPAGMAVALVVALLVAQKLRGMAIFRTLFYIPAISSGVAIAMLWIYVFLPESGLINVTTKVFGIPSVDFLNQTAWAMPALAFMSAWTGLGPRMVLFLAGLLGIPQSLYEAAELDGATRWHSFWKVTIPMLVPTTFFVLVTSTIGAMQVFTPVYMMTKGGPGDENGNMATDVVGYHIYTEAWVNFNTGLAAA